MRRPVNTFAAPAGKSLVAKHSAKTIAVLQNRGYVARNPDPADARRKSLRVTALGFDVLRQGEAIFDQLRHRWEQQIGRAQLESLEENLKALIGAMPERFDSLGWISQDPGQRD